MKCSEKFSLIRIQNELYKQIGPRLSNQESQFVSPHTLSDSLLPHGTTLYITLKIQPTSILKHSTWKTSYSNSCGPVNK